MSNSTAFQKQKLNLIIIIIWSAFLHLRLPFHNKWQLWLCDLLRRSKDSRLDGADDIEAFIQAALTVLRGYVHSFGFSIN